jgi:hypothetical protein
VPHRGAQHLGHRGVQALHIVGAQVRDRASWSHPGPPADFVGEQVAEAGDHRLVRQGRFQPTVPPGKRIAKRPAVNAQRIGTLRTHHICDVVLAGGQPHPAQLA